MDEKQVELRLPAKVTYIVLLAWIVALCVFAFVFSALVSVWCLSVSLAVYGVLHLLVPRGVLPQVRSRAFDAALCFLGAALIALLAHGAAVPQLV